MKINERIVPVILSIQCALSADALAQVGATPDSDVALKAWDMRQVMVPAGSTATLIGFTVDL